MNAGEKGGRRCPPSSMEDDKGGRRCPPTSMEDEEDGLDVEDGIEFEDFSKEEEDKLLMTEEEEREEGEIKDGDSEAEDRAGRVGEVLEDGDEVEEVEEDERILEDSKDEDEEPILNDSDEFPGSDAVMADVSDPAPAENDGEEDEEAESGVVDVEGDATLASEGIDDDAVEDDGKELAPILVSQSESTETAEDDGGSTCDTLGDDNDDDDNEDEEEEEEEENYDAVEDNVGSVCDENDSLAHVADVAPVVDHPAESKDAAHFSGVTVGQPSPVRDKAPNSLNANSRKTKTDAALPKTLTKEKPVLLRAPAVTTQSSSSSTKEENDNYCWECHKEGNMVCCEVCPRVYHPKCLGLSQEPNASEWICPECQRITDAECIDSRSSALASVNMDQLTTMLRYALSRMTENPGSEPFRKPVDETQAPDYKDFIISPMDLGTIEKNLNNKVYGSTEAFLADVKWILHNCIVYNGSSNKLTSVARQIVKICKVEMQEIDVCPECYLNAVQHPAGSWFVEPCSRLHPLVWAKLKGFPFWPAKAVREHNGQVDCRFFGAHDRAWVPTNQCYDLSEDMPVSNKNRKKAAGLDVALEELQQHVNKLRQRKAPFSFAPHKQQFDPLVHFPGPGFPHLPPSTEPSPKRPPNTSFEDSFGVRKLMNAGSTSRRERSWRKETPERSTASRVSNSPAPLTSGSLLGPRSSSSPVPNNAPDSLLFSKPETEDSASKDAPTGVFEGSNPEAPLGAEKGEKLILPLGKLLSEKGKKRKDNVAVRLQEKLMKAERGGGEGGTSGSAKEEGENEKGKEEPMEEMESSESRRPMRPKANDQLAKMIEKAKDRGIRPSEAEEEDGGRRQRRQRRPATRTMPSDDDEEDEDEDEPDATSGSSESENDSKLVIDTGRKLDVRRKRPARRRSSSASSDEECEVGKTRSKRSKNNNNNNIINSKGDAANHSSTVSPNMSTTTTRSPRVQLVNIDVGRSTWPSTLSEGTGTTEITPEASNSTTTTRIATSTRPRQESVPSVSHVHMNGERSPEQLPPPSSRAPPIDARVEALTARVLDRLRASVEDLVVELVSATSSSNSADNNSVPAAVNGVVGGEHEKAEERRTEEALQELKWCHKQEMRELRHNMELTMAEWQAVWDLDRSREIEEVKRRSEDEKKFLVEETKKKQWCSQCFKEAIFYCCWNTSYCDYPCQQAHWPVHMATCAQGPNAKKIKKEEEKMNRDGDSEVQVIGQRNRDTSQSSTPSRVGISAGASAITVGAVATPPSALSQHNIYTPSPGARTATGSILHRSGGGTSSLTPTSPFVIRPSNSTTSAFQPIAASPSTTANPGFSPLFAPRL